MFWRVVHAMTETQKRRLLFFATGSDRAPIDGLGALPFVIRRVLSYTGAHTTAFAW
jgi:ubiquitin-protein ligase E3 A